MKQERADHEKVSECLNPLQEVGVMKLWPWEAPPLLAWQGHLRTVAHKCLLDHVQRVHFI